jgi:hypothetical protein
MEKIYSDTSVLLSYVQHWIEENDDVPPLIDSDYWDLHSGQTVETEFSKRRNVRSNLYRLLLNKDRQASQEAETTPIQSMTAQKLPYVSPPPTRNDRQHFEELIDKFQTLAAGDVTTIGEMEIEYECPEDNAFILREYMAEARSREREINQSLNVFTEGYDDELQMEIDDTIDNEQDSAVLAEAVAWRYAHSDSQPDKVVTLDLGDMYHREVDINHAIAEIKNEHAQLDIVRPCDT